VKSLAWPIGIVVALALFMSMTLFYVYRAFSERVDLVTPDYYYRDKEFSLRLEREKKLLQKGQTTVRRRGEAVEIILPAAFADKTIKGKLYFYSPLNPAHDFTITVVGKGATLNLTAPQLKISAAWRVSFDFEALGDKYFFEKKI